MKIFLSCLLLLASPITFARKYKCNIQTSPIGKTINHNETSIYVKKFDFKSPVKQKIDFEFQNVKISLHPSENEDLYVTFKNIKKDFEISSNFNSSQDLITISTGDGETFICNSGNVINEAKLKKTTIFDDLGFETNSYKRKNSRAK